MKSFAIIGLIFCFSLATISLQNKSLPVKNDPTAYVIKDLDSYKESGSKTEERNPFTNPTNYKKTSSPEKGIDLKDDFKNKKVKNNNPLTNKGNYKAGFSNNENKD